MKDHLVKAVADGVRVYAAVTTDLVNEAIRRHGCHAVAAAALGRTMTGALLLAANGAADAQVTTLELSEERAALAHSFIARSPYEGRIEILQGDAGELLTELEGPYDFVFIDAAKGQYVDYFEKVQPLLTADATIVADNVLFRGYVMGKEKAPRRYRTIVKRLRRYIELTSHAAGYETEIFERGDGLAVSRRCPAANESNRLSEEYHTC